MVSDTLVYVYGFRFFFFFFFFRFEYFHSLIETSGTENRGKGNSAKGKEKQKPSSATKFRTFRQKYEIYEIKSRTKICAITVQQVAKDIQGSIGGELRVNVNFVRP